MSRKQTSKVTLSFPDEFGAPKVKGLCDSFGENVTLQDLDAELSDNQFAIVQKTDEGLKRRFPLCDEVSVRLGMNLLKDAADLSETEKEKAATLIMKAAKKFGIEGDILADADPNTDGEKQTTEDSGTPNSDGSNLTDGEDGGSQEEETDELTKLTDSIKALVDKFVSENVTEEGELNDAATAKVAESSLPSPVEVIFACLTSLGNEIAYCGKMIESMVTGYLKERGKEAVSKETKDSYDGLQDQVNDLQEQVEMLDEQNMTLNKQLRDHYVDEVLSHKAALNLIEDSEAEKTKCSKLGYETLKTLVDEYRSMRIKLKDSVVSDKSVNNSVDIKKVQDPTLVDSDNSDANTDLNDGEHKEVKTEKKPMTKQDALAVIRSLKK